MKNKKRCMALAAALTMSLALSSTALAAMPTDIGGHWAQGTIIQWTSKGYISGYPDGTFKPNNSITRAEFVRLVNEAMGYTKTGYTYFSDVSASYWGYNDIQKGVAAGYVRGDGNGIFRPDDPVSRQEAAVMISQICSLGQDYASAAKYSDYRYIASWAAGYVGAVSKAGIMAGYPDGDFKGDRYLTRAEAVIALDKTLNYKAPAEDDREELNNYTLKETSLKDKIIKGDLVISSSLSKKDISLDNVKVEGKIIVEGGRTITAKNCEINELEMSYSDAAFSATGKTTVKKTTFEKYGRLTGSGYTKVVIDEDFNDYVTLDAEIKEVELDEETNIKLLSDCVIDTFTATKNADNATINFNSAKVKDMYLYDEVRITGKGDIKDMTVYASGVRSSIKPDDLSTKNGASKPTYTQNSSGDITYGGSSRYDDLTASRYDKTYRGGKYDDVKVTGEDITLEDMTIYGNLTIDDDVREGNVSLEDLVIKGNVYIEGGGKNSITFEDCEISGNIYVRKSYKYDPVAVEFDKYTASHLKGKVIISENGAIIEESESGVVLDNVEVRTSSEVVIETDVKSLDVITKTSNLTINSGSDITKLTVSSNAKGSTFTVKGKVKEIYTNVDITVKDSGTVEKTSGSGTVNGISVTGVKLNKTELSLEKGQTETLTATIEPSTATNKSLSWSSNKESVAKVDNSGKITAVGEGTATITVTTADGGKTATCKVTVSEKAQEVKVTIEGPDKVTDGSTIKLTAKVEPEGAKVESTTWQSKNPETAKVNQGNITTVAPGQATIMVTVKTSDGKEYTAEKTITVEENKVEATGVTIEGSDTVAIDGTLNLMAEVEPEGAEVKELKWSSSVPDVAKVNKGKITPESAGTTDITVTVTTLNNKTVTSTKKITVTGADKTALNDAINSASLINPTQASDGTTVSMKSRWAADLNGFNNALSNARTVAADNGATNAEVADALNKLNTEVLKLNYGIKEFVDLVNGYKNTQAGVQPAVINVHVFNSDEEAASLLEGEKWILKTNEQTLINALNAADTSINTLKLSCSEQNNVTSAINTFKAAVDPIVVVKHGAVTLL